MCLLSIVLLCVIVLKKDVCQYINLVAVVRLIHTLGSSNS